MSNINIDIISMMRLLIILCTINNGIGLMNEAPYLLGTYLLRKTNDKAIISKYTYLILNEDDNFKLKTINLNGIFATKISKNGKFKFIKNYKTIFNPLYYLTINNKLNNIVADNDVKLIIKFNNINKYVYSFFGVEYPEIKYKQNSDYSIQKNIRVKQKDNTLYVSDIDNNLYYLFDLNQNLSMYKLPYVETAINNLLFTQLISFVINFILIKIINF